MGSTSRQITIMRAKHGELPYFMMNRSTAQDAKLSWEARGVLAYLLSKPDDWIITLSDLQQNCGRDKARNILSELIKYGYVTKTEQVKKERGRFDNITYQVHERPFTEKPSTVGPSTENPTLHNTDIQNTENKEEKALAADKQPPALTDEDFYIVLPDHEMVVRVPILPGQVPSGYNALQGKVIKAESRFKNYQLVLSAPLPDKPIISERIEEAPPVPPPPPAPVKTKQPPQYGDMFVLVNRYAFKASKQPLFMDLTGKVTKALLRVYPDAMPAEFECFAKDWKGKRGSPDFPSGEQSLPKNFGLWRETRKGVTDANNSAGRPHLRGLRESDFDDEQSVVSGPGTKSA